MYKYSLDALGGVAYSEYHIPKQTRQNCWPRCPNTNISTLYSRFSTAVTSTIHGRRDSHQTLSLTTATFPCINLHLRRLRDGFIGLRVLEVHSVL